MIELNYDNDILNASTVPREIAKLLKTAGDPLEKIAAITGLSVPDIEKL